MKKSSLELKSKHSGKRLKIGDPVVVQIIASNIDTGQIDFEIVKHKPQKTRPKTVKSKPIRSNSTNKKTNNKGIKRKVGTRKKQIQKCTKKRRRKYIH